MGARFLKIAVVYLTAGVLLGLIMGIIHDFRLTSVHAHINLLGWVSMAVFGLMYHFYPRAAESTLAKSHFWLHNICVPVMQVSIALQLLVSESFLPVTIVSSILVVVGVILFAVNIFLNVGAKASVSSDTNIGA
jgi:cbb3-type cytochrome oxidase subunit 1